MRTSEDRWSEVDGGQQIARATSPRRTVLVDALLLGALHVTPPTRLLSAVSSSASCAPSPSARPPPFRSLSPPTAFRPFGNSAPSQLGAQPLNVPRSCLHVSAAKSAYVPPGMPAFTGAETRIVFCSSVVEWFEVGAGCVEFNSRSGLASQALLGERSMVRVQSGKG